jgi:hypothetical protein
MMNKYTIGTIIGSALLGMAKSYGSSSKTKAYAKRSETITLSFMDWYAWLDFTPENFATIDQEAIRRLEYTSIELPNPFPEVHKAKMFFNEVLFEGGSSLLLNIHIAFELYPNTFLDLKQNRSSREHIDELAGKLFEHAIHHINEFVNNNLPSYNYYGKPSDAKYFEQYEDEGHEDWLSDHWVAEESALLDAYDSRVITYGKNNVVIDIREKFFITDKEGNILKYNEPKKSNLRRA